MMRGRYRQWRVAMVIMSTTWVLLPCRPGLTDEHAATSVKSNGQRPNIVLIMADDQNYDGNRKSQNLRKSRLFFWFQHEVETTGDSVKSS